MKKNQFVCLTLATALLASSCTSSYQAAGGVTGAMIGSHVGGAVGVLAGHGPFRGESAALGSLIGMGIGAILGVGITSQIEEQEKAEARRYEDYRRSNGSFQKGEYDDNTNESYQYGGYDDNNVGYQISGGYQGGYQGNVSNHNYQIGNGAVASTVLSISELSYMDVDGDGYISKGETIEVEGYITNTSNSILRDIVIYLNVNEPKSFSVSPSLTTTLQPGQKIRYTGRVHGNRTRGQSSLGINLNTDYAGKTYTSNTLLVRVK